MAEATKTPEASVAAPAPRSGLFGKLMICGFMGTVIAAEALVSYLLIPNADDVASKAEQIMTEKMHKNISAHSPESKKMVEVDLGEYSITSHQVETNTSLRIDFKLFGVVAEEDQNEVKELIERRKHEFRDQIIFEIRDSDITDLSDPGLGLIKRRILEKSNRLLEESLLQKIVFSDFSFVEQ